MIGPQGVDTLMKTVMRVALALVVGAGVTATAQAGAGSWSTEASGLMVAMSDRASASQALSPPPLESIAQGHIERVHWRFESPPGAGLYAWLCHGERCVELDGQRGSTKALGGLTARAPLEFRFALARGQRPVRVKGLHVIVNYQ